MATPDIQAQAQTILSELETRLRIKGRSLPHAARKAKHLLPRQVYRDIGAVADAAKVAGHPKLAVTQNSAKALDAAQRVLAHLQAIDPADRRKGAILGWLGGVSFNLIVLFVLLLVVLIWRGFL